jgi:hemoglobin
MTSLLDRIGGEDAVKAVVNAFYDKVFTDPLLLPFFANTDFAKQRVRQTAFMVKLMAGKAPNAGAYMRTVHRTYVEELGLNDNHFDAVGGHLVAAMTAFKVPAELIAEAGAVLESLRADVLDRPRKAAA